MTPHVKPRYSSFADKEAQASLIYLTFKQDRRKLRTPAEYLSVLEEEVFESCVNERLYKVSREIDPPFYSASVRIHRLFAVKTSLKLRLVPHLLYTGSQRIRTPPKSTLVPFLVPTTSRCVHCRS